MYALSCSRAPGDAGGSSVAHAEVCGAGCVPVAAETCVRLRGITDLCLSAVAADGTPQMARDASVWATESVCSHQSPCQH